MCVLLRGVCRSPAVLQWNVLQCPGGDQVLISTAHDTAPPLKLNIHVQLLHVQLLLILLVLIKLVVHQGLDRRVGLLHQVLTSIRYYINIEYNIIFNQHFV